MARFHTELRSAKSLVHHGIPIRKATSGYAVLWPTQPTSFCPNIEAAKALVMERRRRKVKM